MALTIEIPVINVENSFKSKLQNEFESVWKNYIIYRCFIKVNWENENNMQIAYKNSSL